MSLTRPDVNAKQMFFIGLFGLPWLWVVNVMYHFRAVYGNGNASSDGEGENGENAGILGGMMSESEDNDQAEDADPELVKSELRKWVLRSTIGSIFYFLVLVTWIIVFQVNRESFGPKWFVMSQEEETLTGW